MFASVDRRRTAAAALAASLALSCGSSETIVVVEVAVEGQLARPVYQLLVDASVSGENRSIRVPSGAQDALTFPTDFTLQLPRDKTGLLTLTIIGRDATGVEVVRGMGSIGTLTVGGSNHVRVVLGESAVADAGARLDAARDSSPPADAAADAADDAAGDGGVDAGDDAAVDAALDAAADAGADVGADAAPDTAVDAPADAAPDAAPDVAPDAGDARDAGADGAADGGG
jgi:hypothetical protein